MRNSKDWSNAHWRWFCDDMFPCTAVELIATFRVAGMDSFQALRIGCYDDKWYISDLNSYFSNMIGMAIDVGGLYISNEPYQW